MWLVMRTGFKASVRFAIPAAALLLAGCAHDPETVVSAALANIGGQGSDAQRLALEWLAKIRPRDEEPYDNGYPDDETPAHVVEAEHVEYE